MNEKSERRGEELDTKYGLIGKNGQCTPLGFGINTHVLSDIFIIFSISVFLKLLKDQPVVQCFFGFVYSVLCYSKEFFLPIELLDLYVLYGFKECNNLFVIICSFIFCFASLLLLLK